MRTFLLVLILLVASDNGRVANEAFQRGDFPAAEAAYREAIAQNPDDARLHFNLGNALAEQQKFDEAIQAYERFRSMTNNPSERALADYNIGNMYGMQQKWDKAADQFRNALRQNPTDEEAKFNFEYANRSQQQQEEQEQQSGDSDQQEQDDSQESQAGDDEQQSPQNDQQDGDSNDEGQQENQQQDQETPDQPQDGQEESRPQPKMSQEDADRMLNAMDSKEQDLLRDFHRNQLPPSQRHAKDW
ncbi:MAG: tetratricopeptide repeat protein [Balneolales bacterium]|nr:tetratricopeptide repeat protein [Balneolales bacterium]